MSASSGATPARSHPRRTNRQPRLRECPTKVGCEQRRGTAGRCRLVGGHHSGHDRAGGAASADVTGRGIPARSRATCSSPRRRSSPPARVPRHGVLDEARRTMAKVSPGTTVGCGAQMAFADVNRAAFDGSLVQALAFPTCPTVHRCDDDSIMANVDALGDTIATARRRSRRPTPAGRTHHPGGATWTLSGRTAWSG